MQPDVKRGRGRPHEAVKSADDILNRSAVLSLTDVSTILGMDRSTVLRKEREGLLAKRRDIAGRLVFLAADVRVLLADSKTVDGPDPERSDRSRKAREIALARSAGKREAA